ncbi:MAG: ferric reductase-like transmembrane domain-containing protein [Candidatus Moraniibacteriota bacterium]
MKKKNRLLIFGVMLGCFLSWQTAKAQEKPKVDYANQIVVDSDLDGLTDQGENQIYHSDPQQMDTDGDGFGDGVEVLAGSDPLDTKAYPGAPAVSEAKVSTKEAPTAWYASRASGLVAFLLLYISIFLGLTLRIPLLRKIFAPLYAMQIHCWLSVQALLFAFFHAAVLLFDKWLGFKLVDLFVPFAAEYQPNLTALGVLGFYLMLILVVTSYARKLMSQKIWRAVHFTNLVLYAIVFVHALYLGTDLKVQLFRDIFLWANAGLVFLMLVNLELRIFENISRKKKETSFASGGVDIIK